MNPSQPRRYFDVAPPGKAAPSPTSRPVIARPPAPDPLLHQTADPPIAARPQPVPSQAPAPVAEAAPQLDPTDLLIQAGDFTPLKPSKSRVSHAALIVMLAVVVILCAATYWLVTTM